MNVGKKETSILLSMQLRSYLDDEIYLSVQLRSYLDDEIYFYCM
jgi:hypothetical protein